MNNAGNLKKIEKLEEKRKSDKIAKYLTSGDEETVVAALEALGRIGDETGINSVTSFIDHPDAEIRKASIRATGEIGTEYSKSMLQNRIQQETDEEIKQLILEMVRKINK